MLKTLAAQIKQYKKSTILTPIFAALEVVMEVLIPMAMARLVKYGIEGGDTGAIYRYGFLMMAMAMLSLVFGSVCAHTASHASTGFAANLRDGMYRNIQRFSFANIDKYSTAGLVTRMTTDVTNVQNAFQMITRIAVRSPLTLIFSMIAAFVINPELAGVFLIPLVLLGVVLGLIIKRATHLFDQVFKKYDDLNASVQENVSGIRVVKAFVREDFEDKKFGKAATNVYNLFVKAERIIAFNSPVMMLTIYGSVMALSWLGASLVTGGSLDVGDLTAMFTYVMNMLMNLMMLSMIFVMLTMSAASARRIVEVLNEEPSLSNPEQPLETVKDGSIDFNHVMFKYHADGNGDPILNDVDLHIKSGETVGIIGGTIISSLLTCVWFEPYVLMRYGIEEDWQKKLRRYFMDYIVRWVVVAGVSAVSYWIFQLMPQTNFLWFIAQGLIYTAIFAAVVLVVYGRTPEFQYLLEMTVRKLKKKLRGGA